MGHPSRFTKMDIHTSHYSNIHMIKVYFETHIHSELVAVFADEETYHACLPALEINCKQNGFEFLSESVDDTSIDTIEN